MIRRTYSSGSSSKASKGSASSRSLVTKVKKSTSSRALGAIRRTFSSRSKKELPKDLKVVLSTEKWRKSFKEFLVNKMAVELLLFYDSLELYEKLSNDTWRTRAGTSLLNTFILEGSQYEVNLSSETRNELAYTNEFTEETFKDTKQQVYKLMESNFFKKYIELLEETDNASKPDAIRRVSTLPPTEIYVPAPNFEMLKTSNDDAFQQELKRISSSRRLTAHEQYFAQDKIHENFAL